MKTVKLTEILDYYDRIQLFAAKDPIGGHYVCNLIDTVGDFDRYVVVGVRPERLDDFRNDKVDLRTLLLDFPDGAWYITVADGTIDDPLTLEPQQEPLVETDYLPDEEFFLEETAPIGETEIQRALERGKVVTVMGSVEQVNRSAGEWSLLTDHGIKAGKTAAGGPSLDGLQIGKCYRFKCAEITELDPLWRNRKTLYLQGVATAPELGYTY